MTVSPRLRCLPSRFTAAPSGFRLALDCAARAHAGTDRRRPEAAALVSWLAQNAAAFGLDDADLPDEDAPRGRRRRGISAPDWHRVGAALTAASAGLAAATSAPADRWLAAIAGRLALDPIETAILSLALHYRLDPRVEQLFDMLSDSRGGQTRFHRDPRLIALLLGAEPAEIEARLTPQARLATCGLLHVGHDGSLYALSRLVALIRGATAPAADFYDQLLGTTALDPLPWEAFAHLGRAAEIAAGVLRAALVGRESGVHILLYGPHGTGKTSFAATLAARIGARLRPVAEADEGGDEPDRDERLAGLRLADRLAVPGQSLLLFDEAEDLFAPRLNSLNEPRPSSRVFLHRLLERLALPVIWTANDIRVLGPAVLRRMTMCLEMKVPNLATRTRLWRRMGEAEGVVLGDADAARLARLVPAAPAMAVGALRAARLAGGGAETARLIVEGVARAVCGAGLPAPEREDEAHYDPALVNADCDLAALTADLLRPGAPRAVSFLLSGPPGAGKSAWVRHLAARMGLAVLPKRASDLLDAFVGGTEQNIAGAFAEARESGAILVFDEADSLLLERADA
ncbi:MAG: AAA family ATPase, partial [Acetobacteraceae bacterium]